MKKTCLIAFALCAFQNAVNAFLSKSIFLFCIVGLAAIGWIALMLIFYSNYDVVEKEIK